VQTSVALPMNVWMRFGPLVVIVPPEQLRAPPDGACASSIGWKVPGIFACAGGSGSVATSMSAASCGSKQWPCRRHPAASRSRKPFFMF
jgi:hypothetical protein